MARLCFAALLAYVACAPIETPRAPAEAVSLLGETLYAPDLDAATRRDREQKLAEARARHAASPGDVEAVIWLGRRTAYLGRYREAIAIYTAGIRDHPNDARLHRHRGHRYITVRELDRAIVDLRRAAGLRAGADDEIEPDGLPNRWGIPTSTLHANIHYHLGLAHYLKGELDRALGAYRECMRWAKSEDMLVATAYWLYLTLLRTGRDDEAAALLTRIGHDMRILENESYHRLLLRFKGARLTMPRSGAIDDATIGYGLGFWHAHEGRRAEAERIWSEVIAGREWAAFGFIAAEADLARLKRAK
jgi:tetratricopeptide (TPR) repeat protein